MDASDFAGTTYRLDCECGEVVGMFTGQQRSMSTGTMRKPLTVADASTSLGDAFVDRAGYDRMGRWTVVDETTKRARIEERPDFVPTCGPVCGHSVVCRPRTAAAGAGVGQVSAKARAAAWRIAAEGPQPTAAPAAPVAVPATALRGNSLDDVCTCGSVHWAKAVDEPRVGRRAGVVAHILRGWGYELAGDWQDHRAPSASWKPPSRSRRPPRRYSPRCGSRARAWSSRVGGARHGALRRP